MRVEIGLALMAAIVVAAIGTLILVRNARRRARREARRPISVKIVDTPDR